MSMLDDLYLPDGKALSTQIIGRPGSGKSYFLRSTLLQFLKKHKDENYRLIFICPKHEFYLDDKNPPIGVDKLEKTLRKKRVAIMYPDPYNIDAEVDYAIEMAFAFQQSNPEFTCTFCVDDSQVFISSRRAASNSFRRLALTGRSKGIRFTPVSHQAVFSKDLEASTSYLVMFSMPVKLYHKDLNTRFGFDVEPFVEPIASKDYSFVFYDVTRGKAQLYDPITVG